MKTHARHIAYMLAAGAAGIGLAMALADSLTVAAPAVPRAFLERGVVRDLHAKDHFWYISPLRGQRAFIGSPADAATVISRFGWRINNRDLARIPPAAIEDATEYPIDRQFAGRMAGRILLQSEAENAAWYVDPLEFKRYRLGTPEQAYRLLYERAAVIGPDRAKAIPVSDKSPSWLIPPPGYVADIVAVGFDWPRVLAWDPAGHLVVSDYGEKSKIIAFADQDGDGSFETRKTIVSNLLNGHGIAFLKDRLYVAREHRLEYWPYDPDTMSVTRKSAALLDLPPGGEHFPGQGHKTRTLAAGQDGRLYLSIGSACDHCVDLDKDEYAVIKRLDPEGNGAETFATGLRNTVFFAQHPATGQWWGNDMGRDDLGNDLPPDEVNLIEPGKDYGWPLCYGDRQAAPEHPNPAACDDTEPPAITYPPHSAPLGLAFVPAMFRADWENDLFSALHGSTLRPDEARSGYAIVRIDMDENGRPAAVEDAVTGFQRNGVVIVGRPVALLFAEDGALYVSDDYARVIHRIRRAALPSL